MTTARLATNAMARNAGHRPCVLAAFCDGVQLLAWASYEEPSDSPGAGIV